MQHCSPRSSNVCSMPSNGLPGIGMGDGLPRWVGFFCHRKQNGALLGTVTDGWPIKGRRVSPVAKRVSQVRLPNPSIPEPCWNKCVQDKHFEPISFCAQRTDEHFESATPVAKPSCAQVRHLATNCQALAYPEKPNLEATHESKEFGLHCRANVVRLATTHQCYPTTSDRQHGGHCQGLGLDKAPTY